MKNLRYYIDLIEQAGTTTLGPSTPGSSASPGNSSFGSNLAGTLGNKIGAGVARTQIGAAKIGGAAGAFAGGYRLAKQGFKNPENMPLANTPEQQRDLDAIVTQSQEIEKNQDDLGKNIQRLKQGMQQQGMQPPAVE